MGVEPISLTGHHFKWCAYTSSATRAYFSEKRLTFFVRPGAESNRRIELLQSSALPLGHQVLSRNFSPDLKARQFVGGFVRQSQSQNLYEEYVEYEICLGGIV